MKFLLDLCVSGRARADLETAGHDVVAIGDRGPDPGDDQILAIAHREGRILVTIDKDFGELAVRQRAAHSGIVRLVGFRGSDQGRAVLGAVGTHAKDVEAGALLTVEPGRVRVRR